MLPTVLPRTGRAPSAAGATSRPPPERQPDRPLARRRTKRPTDRPRTVIQARSAKCDRASPKLAAVPDDTPLGRVRQAMSRHQVDAILVLSRDNAAPMRWVTRDGLVRNARREPSAHGARQAGGDLVTHLRDLTSLAQLREIIREPDVARVLIWCDSAPLAIVNADELFAHTRAAANGSTAAVRLRRGPGHSTAESAAALAGHGRRLLGLVARAQPDADGWTSESQLESMVAGGRLEWRVQALEVLTAAGLLERVQRDGQFDYRLTLRGLELAHAHSAASSSGPRRPLQRR
jgi:hypothetical protein